MSNDKSFKVQNGLDVTGDASVSGSVTATSFIGDGSQLTGISGGSGGGLDSAETIALIGMQNKPAGDNSIQITPDTSTLNGDNNNIIIGNQISDMAGVGPQAVAMGNDIGAQANGVSIGYQAGAGSQSTNTGGVFIGSRTNYYGNSNPADYAIAIGHEAGAIYPGVGSVALGKSAGAGSSGDYTVAIGYNANNTSSFNNTIMIKADGSSAHNSTAQYDIDIRTSDAGSLTYDTTNDWVFGAPVTSSEFKFADGTSMTTAPTGGSGGGLDSDGVLSVFDNETIIKLGDSTTVSAPRTIAIGVGSSAASSESMAVGAYASASGIFSIALGRSAATSYEDAIAIGRSATSSQADSIAMGTSAVASGSRSIAIGNSATANSANSVTIGSSASGSLTYDTTNDWVFGSSVTLPGATVSGHIIPDTNAAYDLGSAEKKFRHLYLSNNSLYAESGRLSFEGGQLTFRDDPVLMLSEVQAIAAASDTFEDFKAALASL